jgi:pyridoxal phosphate enzyme (YggS family)
MIEENLKIILQELPKSVELVVAVKDRSIEEVESAVRAGAKAVGENYVKEAQAKFEVIGNRARWHFIGHLQKNKAKDAVKIFDMIETLDSPELAEVLNRECEKIGKIMPVLIEVNCAAEPQKYGVLPQDVKGILKKILFLNNIKPMGLMTMGPFLDEIEKIRPFFKKTKELFDEIKSDYADKLEWRYLSMGMSDSYKIAIEEGANIVRIGTAIFGERR